GGFVTMALPEKLESTGLEVVAAATASAPVDVAVSLKGFLNFPREIDAPWVTTTFILSAFAFENYYGVPGLAGSVINDEHYDVSRTARDRGAFDPAAVPTDLRKLHRRECLNPLLFAASAYGRLVERALAYRWAIQTPVRNYYVEGDEATSTGLGQLPITYRR